MSKQGCAIVSLSPEMSPQSGGRLPRWPYELIVCEKEGSSPRCCLATGEESLPVCEQSRLHEVRMRPKLGREGGEVMRTPDNSDASMARINGILIRSAIVVAIAATIVLPLLR